MMENNYDAFADSYTADNEHNAWNAYYERPAILSLIGDAKGLQVLDAGCGAGAHSEVLLNQGAVVTGVDNSAGLVKIAEKRLGGKVRLLQADLNQPLPFKNSEFDVVFASLVMHYLPEWSLPLAEFNRVLSDGGRFVFSIHHPFMDHALAGRENYFETYQFDDVWERGGQSFTMRFWHRSLNTIFEELLAAGFQIEVLSEPQPLASTQTLFPEAYKSLTTKPRFLFFSCRKII